MVMNQNKITSRSFISTLSFFEAIATAERTMMTYSHACRRWMHRVRNANDYRVRPAARARPDRSPLCCKDNRNDRPLGRSSRTYLLDNFHETYEDRKVAAHDLLQNDDHVAFLHVSESKVLAARVKLIRACGGRLHAIQ